MRGFADKIGTEQVHPTIECLNQALVADAHERQMRVWVYTVDREEDIATCLKLGVDAIVTNFPAQSRLIAKQIQEVVND